MQFAYNTSVAYETINNTRNNSKPSPLLFTRAIVNNDTEIDGVSGVIIIMK